MGAGALSAGFGREVLARVRELELLAAGVPSSPAVAARARGQLRELLGVWSRLLAAHAAGAGGRCPACRTWWWGRRRWPCRVWLAAHASLVRAQPAEMAPDPATVWPGLSILGRSPGAGVR